MDEELMIMDWKRFQMFTDGDPQEAKELIDLFIEGAEESLELMFRLCSEHPDENWKIAIHKLKGSAANLGANILARHCKEAEMSWTEPYSVKQSKIDIIVEDYTALRSALDNPVLKVEDF